MILKVEGEGVINYQQRGGLANSFILGFSSETLHAVGRVIAIAASETE